MEDNSLIVADDATGALEVGALLAGAGVRVSVELKPQAAKSSEARVLLLPTRHLPAQQVRAMLEQAIGGWAGDLLYWKTDSTLRGPIGDCFSVLLALFPDRRIVYFPAYPEVGRTVIQGRLFVHGVPLNETEFAGDPLNPVRTAAVRELLNLGPLDEAADAGQLRQWLRSGSGTVIVCDAETEAQMAALVDECRGLAATLVLAGPAGVMRHWAGAGNEPAWPPVERWRVVCGSLHPVSRAQARASAVEVWSTPDAVTEGGPDELKQLARRVAEAGASGLIIFGGDTALAVWQVMGITALEPLGEILPGVAVSRWRDRVFVTKAGGYGGAELVREILERWKT